MRKPFRREVLAGLAALPAASPWVSAGAQTADFPDRPLRFIVGVPPGGPSDRLARLIAPGIGERLGRTVVVENNAGANGDMAASLAARSLPDGGVFMLASNGSTTVAAALGRKMAYDIRTDFVAVAPVGIDPMLLLVRPDLQVKDAAELLDLARVHQGGLKGGSTGTGGATHLALELFKAMARLDIVHVPYKGSGPAMADLRSGQIDLCFAALSTALPHVKAGKICGLGQTGLVRSAAAPRIPTIAELGLPGYEAVMSYGVFLPAGAPAVLVERLHAAIDATIRSPPVAKKLAGLGADPQFGSPAEFASYVARDYAKWAYLAKEARLKAD